MSRHAEVYELGNVDRTFGGQRPERAAPASAKRRAHAVLGPERVALLASDVTRSLSFFAPGASQIAQRRFSLGLFYFSALIFMATLASAVVTTMDRLTPTLELLGRSIGVAFWTLILAFVIGATLHLSAVWTALPSMVHRPVRHPLVPAVASAVLPGWGQALNGDRLRAMLFLGGCWLVAGAWIVASPAATEFINTYSPVVAPWEQSARAPLIIWSIKWTTPLIIWCLAVYDAAASAAGRRNTP